MTVEEIAVDHRRATDAGSQRQHDDVAATCGRALPHFAQQRRLRVVEHSDGRGTPEEIGPVQALKLGQSPRHPPDRSPVRRSDARRGDADRIRA